MLWGICALALLAAATWSCRAGRSDPLSYIHAVIEAQAAYAELNGGFYDRLECLASPEACLPEGGDRPSVPGALLTTAPPRAGWASQLYLGRKPRPGKIKRRAASPSSAMSYVLLVVPLNPQADGARFLCADHTGGIRVSSENLMPVLTSGRCPEDWESLETEEAP